MMRRARSGTRPKTDYVAKAEAAWGKKIPDWVLVLAEYATKTTGVIAAEKIGYCGAIVSQVTGNKYPGDLARVEEKVRGALMGVTVLCPILGEIGRHQCLDEQGKPFTASSSIRSKLFRACRSGCQHSRLQRD